MGMLYSNILEKIGNTPLIKINKLNRGYADIYVKVESFNPAGCVKERIALAMIEKAEKDGVLTKESVIIEPTSGNTGVGLAMVSAVKGYKLILTMPETMSQERRSLLKAFGAELVLTPGEKGMKGCIDRAEELSKEYKNSFIPQQFNNMANPEIHKKTTALEIINDTDGILDYFVAGVGTGGTIAGVGGRLKESIDRVKIVAVEPEESAVLSGENPGPHKIQGIGAGFIPNVMDIDVVDEVIKVSSVESFEMAKQLARQEGILAGISSGAALQAAIKISERVENKGKRIVVLLPDTGERYLSTGIFD